MRCKEMILLFIPYNFIYSILGLDVDELKSMLKLDFKLVFPSTSHLFFIHI